MSSSNLAELQARNDSPPDLDPAEAHIWHMALDPVSVLVRPEWCRLLDDTERAVASRFVREADRQSYIAAHALMRTMLCRFGGIAAPGWRFVLGPHGKPAVHPELGRPRLQFNLSHTRSTVVCAVTLDHAIGVDVECRMRAPFAFDIAESYFAPDEIEQIRNARPEARGDLFLALWTLKESYVKAVGTGLSLPLDQFAFRLSPIRIAFSPALLDDARCWHFQTMRPTMESVLSVAVRAARPVRMHFRSVGPKEIGYGSAEFLQNVE